MTAIYICFVALLYSIYMLQNCKNMVYKDRNKMHIYEKCAQ